MPRRLALRTKAQFETCPLSCSGPWRALISDCCPVARWILMDVQRCGAHVLGAVRVLVLRCAPAGC
jgi:hypothetical protein